MYYRRVGDVPRKRHTLHVVDGAEIGDVGLGGAEDGRTEGEAGGSELTPNTSQASHDETRRRGVVSPISGTAN